MTRRPVSRRRAIVLGAASLAAGVTGWVTTAGAGFVPTGTGAPLAQPPVLASRDGLLRVELTAARGARLAGRDTRALAFNGTSPGPTLRVRPGDELAIRLTNRLDEPTNLHPHGLRVSPRADGDNPFLRIDPSASFDSSFDYRHRIPADHPPGTHWYHPHHHGTVADQIFGGLAGALLVDAGPPPPVAEDRVLLVTDTTLDADGAVAAPSPMDRAMGRQGELVLVNGQHRPTIPAAPGARQRWRIVNACVSRVLDLRLTGHDLVQIAQDGTYLPAPVPRQRVTLAPGNRVDVLVTPTGTGRHPLVAEPVARGDMGMTGGAAGAGPTVTLAEFEVTGPPQQSPPLPATLPAEPAPPATPTASREITFGYPP